MAQVEPPADDEPPIGNPAGGEVPVGRPAGSNPAGSEAAGGSPTGGSPTGGEALVDKPGVSAAPFGSSSVRGSPAGSSPRGKPRVGLFVTCLVDLYRPSIGFAAIRLLEEAGCQVEVPRAQTCCGQPAYNAGDRATARDLARGILDAFGGYDYVVAPSGSCGGMLKHHLPHLFDDDPNLRPRADALAGRTFELVSFLTDVLGVQQTRARYGGSPVTYHDSCSGLRELGIKQQPRNLLRAMGVEVVEMADPEICCGFGGTFCVKYPEISVRMASDKARDSVATGAQTVLAGDLGCLLNLAGRLTRERQSIKVRHVAEVLAGMTDAVPPIGHGSSQS